MQKNTFSGLIFFIFFILFNYISIEAQTEPESVEAPDFSVSRGFFKNSFDVTVTSQTDGAVIKYTLDGSDPITSLTAMIQDSPATINIDPESTDGQRGKTPGVVLRACILSGGAVSESITQTYIFINQVKNQNYPGGNWPVGPVNNKILDYEMDPDIVNDNRYEDLIDDALLEIPSICINTDLKNLFNPQIGIYVNPTGRGIEWERPASVELLNPDGSEGFQINAGLRIRGGYSRVPTGESGQYKHAFRFFFRQEYGKGKLEYPLFGDEGVSKFDAVDLRTAQNYSWSYQTYSSHVCIFVRELFSRDCQRDMGQPYTRTRQYHLYLNGVYWGLYQTQERSEASYAESYFGGDKSNYDVVKSDPVNGSSLEATDGTLDAFNQLWSYSNSGLSTNEAYFKVQGKDPDGSENMNYPVLCNVDNLIDYLLIIYYTGNFDSPVTAFGGNTRPNNFYGIYNRMGRSGFLFFAHDAEHSLMDPQYSENSDYGLDRTGPYSAGNQKQYFNPQWLHQKLSANVEYRVKFSDHIYMHLFNGGVLTALKSQQRLATRTAEIDTAVIAESARWGDAKRETTETPRTKDDDWAPSVSWIINSFFPNRTEVLLQQLKTDNLYPAIDPPIFENNNEEIIVNSLVVEPGYVVKLKNPKLINPNNVGGSIKYTIDGQDPRLIGGSISGSAIDGSDEIELTVNTTKVIKARVLNGTTWSALHKIILFKEDEIGSLKITEINYHPLDNVSSMDTINDDEYEFIELKNTGSTPINLSQAFFVDGLSYTFPDGTIVDPGSFIVLASNRQEFNARYEFFPFGEYTGQLNNGGETITLVTLGNDTISTVSYSDQTPWPTTPDGEGYSLVTTEINPTGNLNDPSKWRASYSINGSPGDDDIPTSAEETETVLPSSVELYQNYPNPFNPDTRIHYEIINNGKVRLSVYDLLGREIAVLVNSVQNAGKYDLIFDGHELSSGIYFCRLRTEDKVITRKMMLLK